MGPYQVLPLQLRVGRRVKAMKGYSMFPKAPTSDGLTSYPEHSLGGEILPLCRDAVGIL